VTVGNGRKAMAAWPEKNIDLVESGQKLLGMPG